MSRLPKNKKELLFTITSKDFKISYFSGSGPGGQSRNRSNACVRISHPDSGAHAVGQSHKSRQQNTKEALTNLVKHGKFKIWHLRRVHEVITGKTLETRVKEAMEPKNLKVEGRDKDGKWQDLPFKENK